MTATTATDPATPSRRAADPETVTPALYDVAVTHHRASPLRYGFTHHTRSWLVDLDDLPRLPGILGTLARFDTRDHLGDPAGSLRGNVERFLTAHGLDPTGGRITMLANPRVLGYVFNPLSLFWCHRSDGSLVAVIAEVHNTYGERHTYLVRPDDAGRATVDKQFYVSPFYPVDGSYRMSVPEPHRTLAVTLTLHRPGERPFVASMRGTRRPGRASLRTALRRPLLTRAVMVHIKRHGIILYLKGLRPRQRPVHIPQEHVR